MPHAVFSTLLLAASLGAESPDFARDVRPILSLHCFKCHGPDEAHREANLRFDTREGALAGGDSGTAGIVPGKPEDSELYRRITSHEDYEIMPPPAAKIPLTEAQIDILKRWIEDGAEYAPHWSFEKPQAVTPPQLATTADVSHPIDRFVQFRLAEQSLSPSPEADRETLIRRLSLDLIGLPPTPEEIDAFLADESPDAYERLVDRLLASPHYGERWARRWLDLARYADTNGYEKDRPRSMWPYRNWVINALNDDLPFDEFTVDQIAGDLLPNATIDQKIATGFHRNTMLNEEGGIDPLEFRFYAMADRVGTTGTTWLGLTVMCAQCHTHKFDPIQHREYYEMLACLNNADEIKLDIPDPQIAAQRNEVQERVASMQAGLAEKFPLPPGETCSAETEVAKRQKLLDQALDKWIEQEARTVANWNQITPAALKSDVPKLEVLADGSVLASGDQSKRDVYTLRFEGDFTGATALRIEALPHESLPKRGPGRTYYEGPEGDFFLSDMTVTANPDAHSEVITLVDGGDTVAKQTGGESSARLAIDDNLQSGWSTGGRIGETLQAVWRFEKPLPETKTLVVELVFEKYYASGLGHFRVALSKDAKEVSARPYTAQVESILRKTRDQWSASENQQVLDTFLALTPELKAARDEIAALKNKMPALPTTLIFQERPQDNPRQTFIHHRGEFLSPTDPVDAGVLSVLNPWPADQPRNRLGFARWLVSRDNPLTARVIVNRNWAAFFGNGIVRTTGDFGYQGDLPTHPELLDWLAIDFMRDWSVKRLHRLIVTSPTYRQSSKATEESADKDPDNRWLGRGPRVRIDAEMVRDAALAASGLLSEKLGGPSVFPPQPASVTTEGAYGQLAWTVSPGEDRYRRGLYTYMKRTTPYAMFATFDGPSGEACLARRDISNTPLQALTLLNDQTMVEAAQSLGRKAAALSEAQGDDPDATRVRWIVRRCLGRSPKPEEAQALVEFSKAARQNFASSAERATAAAGTSSNPVEDATWTAVARAVFNLDEFVTRE